MVRAVTFFLVGVIFASCWLARNSVLREVASLWIVSDEIEPADAIVVLGGAPDVRAPAAAALYRRGLADKILISNTSQREAQNPVALFSEINRETLLQLQVPP